MKVRNTKFQAPSSSETSRLKLQLKTRRAGCAIWTAALGACCFSGVWGLELGASAAAPSASAAQLTPAQTQFFETKIRPLLTKNCYKCHSADSLKLKGELLVD